MKIKDLEVGTTVEITLLVRSAEIRKTKKDKPFLSAELFDGTDVIQAVDWNYSGATPPEKNVILDIKATVSEWADKKQLSINSAKRNEWLGVESFAPQGDVVLDQYVAKAEALIAEVKNPHAKEIVARAFEENKELWHTIPSAKGVHHAFVSGNLKHSVDVAIKAKVLAGVMPGANKDLCIVGGLLQDFGKLWTYRLNGAVIDMTDQGMLLEHIAIGIAKLESFRTTHNSDVLDLILHIVSSHHGKLEYGSPTTPMFLEAWIVHCCDILDSRAQIIYEINAKTKEGDKLTERSYALENRSMFSQSYINKVMTGIELENEA